MIISQFQCTSKHVWLIWLFVVGVGSSTARLKMISDAQAAELARIESIKVMEAAKLQAEKDAFQAEQAKHAQAAADAKGTHSS
jgi:hypothetical protein